jgi:hypothetical protein
MRCRGMDWIELAQDRDTRECGNEPSGSINCRKFLDWLQTSLLIKDSAPWRMENGDSV